MTTNDIMKMVASDMEKNGASPDDIAKMEIFIQYLGNPDFRKKLNDYVFNATYNPGPVK